MQLAPQDTAQRASVDSQWHCLLKGSFRHDWSMFDTKTCIPRPHMLKVVQLGTASSELCIRTGTDLQKAR